MRKMEEQEQEQGQTRNKKMKYNRCEKGEKKKHTQTKKQPTGTITLSSPTPSKMNRPSLALLLLCSLSYFYALAAADTFFYVSSYGSDGNPGTYALPFASIKQAQRAIRKVKAQGLTAPVTVWIEPGYYELQRENPPGPIVFTPEDSGTAQYPIAYVASGSSGSTVISGGVRVTGWTRLGGVCVELGTKGERN